MKKFFFIIFFLFMAILNSRAIVKDDNLNKNLSPTRKEYGSSLNKNFLKDQDFNLTPGAYMANKKYKVSNKEKLKWAFIMSEHNPFL